MIVTLRGDAALDGLVKDHGVKPHCAYRHAFNGFAARLNPGEIEKLKHDPRVIAVEPDGKVRTCAQTNGAGIIRMGVTNFPVAHINGQDHRIGVDVAVMDTGIQTNHPDLNVVNAVGFADPGLNGNDWNGHGTHVAGIVGALDNDFGVVGVAPGARLWAVQVIGPTQSAWSNVFAGLDYIATNTDRISIVNASFESSNGSTPYVAVRAAVSNIVAQGVVFVAAAGNEGRDICNDLGTYGAPNNILPAALPEVMTVSAMVPTNDVVAYFDNYSQFPKPGGYVNSPLGNGIDVIAPGVGILSTYINSGYATLDGTSMASPHVAGLVALYIAANGRPHSLNDVNVIRQAIIDSASPQSQWNNPNPNPNGTNFEPLARASEAWVPKPLIASQSMTLGGFQLSFAAVPGYSYTAQYTASLAASNQWVSLNATNGDGSVKSVTLTDSAPDPTSRCYRLARTPAP
jgi:subtilisin family serine protease